MTSEVDAPYVEDTNTAKHFSYQERTDEQHREALKETFGDGNLKALRSISTGAYFSYVTKCEHQKQREEWRIIQDFWTS